MPKRKLTKRNYLGVGYVHQFVNNQTGEIVFVPCTQEEYEQMGQEGGGQFNPTLNGHTWECSLGGTYKVDTPSTVLGEDEYVEVPRRSYDTEDMIFIHWKETGKRPYHTSLPKTAVDNNDEIDEQVIADDQGNQNLQ